MAGRLRRAGHAVVTSGWAAHDAEQPWGADESVLPDLAADLAEPDAPARLVAAAAGRLSGLDTLIAVHARSSSQALDDLTAAELDLSFAVNARATLLLVQAFAAQFDGSDGRVLTFTSGQHRGPMPGELPYIASKAAVQQLVPSLAATLLPRGITINCIDPGPVDTGWADPATVEEVRARHPRGRWSTPDDIAGAVSWLLAPEAVEITGQTLEAGGGWNVRQ